MLSCEGIFEFREIPIPKRKTVTYSQASVKGASELKEQWIHCGASCFDHLGL
jgi:hypothetical protein